MKSARSTRLAFCLILASTIPAAAAHTITSTNVTDGIIIDGSTLDWGDWPVVYLQDSLRVVGVSHDADNLYIMYRFGDARLAESLLRRGVVLWINGDGKKKIKGDAFGVRYAGSEEIAASFEVTRTADGEAPERHRGETSEGTPREGRAEMRPKAGALVVIRDGDKELVEDPDTRFLAASTATDGVYAYELGIPLDEIGGRISGASPAEQRRLAVGIQLGGLTKAEQELLKQKMSEARSQGGGMGGRGGGMGGRGGSARGGMPPGGGSDDGRGGRRPDLDPEIDWLVVELPAIGG